MAKARTKAKTRTTLTIDAQIWTAVRVRAARTGKRDGEVIEEAVRKQLGLDVLDQLWERSAMAECEATKLALEAQDAVRRDEDT